MIDIHTHHFNRLQEAIHSVTPGPEFIPEQELWYSVGIHPWKTREFLEGNLCTKEELEKLMHHPRVLAVGEVGLDKVHEENGWNEAEKKQLYEESRKLFIWQALLAEETEKPLIIHGVKAMEDLLAVKKDISPSQLWIMHGFRGKPAQATQYLDHGFGLSFGEFFNPDSVRIVPGNLIFAETDESGLSIFDILAALADARSEDRDEFLYTLKSNAERVFKMKS